MKQYYLAIFLFFSFFCANGTNSDFVDINGNIVRLETSIDKVTLTTKEQLLFTATIYHTVSLIDPELPPPIIDNAIVLQAGQIQQGIVNSQKFIKIKWAIFPLQNELMEIPSLLLQTKFRSPILLNSKKNLYTSKLNDVRIKSRPHYIKVNTPLTNVPLAKKIQLKIYPIPNLNSLKVDTPFKYTIECIGINTPYHLLTIPNIKSTDSFSTEIHSIESTNTSDHNGVTGKHLVVFNVTIHKKGIIELPKIAIDWFNFETRLNQTEILPKQILTVLPTAHFESINLKKNSSEKTINKNFFLKVMCCILTFIIIFIIYIKTHTQTIARNIKRQWKLLKKHCKNDNIKKARCNFIIIKDYYDKNLEHCSFNTQLKNTLFMIDSNLFSNNTNCLTNYQILNKCKLLYAISKKHKIILNN